MGNKHNNMQNKAIIKSYTHWTDLTWQPVGTALLSYYWIAAICVKLQCIARKSETCGVSEETQHQKLLSGRSRLKAYYAVRSQRSLVLLDSVQARSGPSIPYVLQWGTWGRTAYSSCPGSNTVIGNTFIPEFCVAMVLKDIITEESSCLQLNHHRMGTQMQLALFYLQVRAGLNHCAFLLLELESPSRTNKNGRIGSPQVNNFNSHIWVHLNGICISVYIFMWILQ
ncbi:uncharacterized protein LOC124397168 [Silurus meridionalis]|uniref:uncharacterized protein LOC124397168 n=1 Tax=Silurus meridionalis TaxID=175797 RepID=UPI001EEBFD6D|nr:uncharacterized protein LOC124397168 [Silurus meridionalis]